MTTARKIAVIGTSNIGAVKYAARAISTEHPDLSVTFYGLPGGKLPKPGWMRRAFSGPRHKMRPPASWPEK